MANVMRGGGGDASYDRREYDKESQEHDHSTLRPKPSYVSKFASKVREDARNRKICWSSMGLPSTLPPINNTAPKSPKPTSDFLVPPCYQHLQTNSLTFGSKRSSLFNIKSKSSSSHKSLPYKHSRVMKLMPCPLSGQKVSKWNSYYKLKPTLVRPRKQIEFEDLDFSQMQRYAEDKQSAGDNEKDEDCGNVQDCNLVIPAGKKGILEQNVPEINETKNVIIEQPSRNQFELSKNNPMITNNTDMEKAICSCHSTFASLDKRNTRGSLPNVISPCLCSRAFEMMQNNPGAIELDKCRDADDVKKKLSDFKSDQALCDAFILQKLLEIRNRVGSNEGKTPPTDENDELPSTCYSGDVNLIDRGERDFILENALKCSRMQAKQGPKVIVDDWKGNVTAVRPRMVFKKDYGQIPEYIFHRKEEIQTEKDLLEKFVTEEANRNCRALSDEERKALIEGLSQNWEKLFLEFQNLPLFSSSHRVLKRKSEIETQLRDLESDIRLISRHGRLFVSKEASPNSFLWS